MGYVPMDQAPSRSHGYHTTLKSFHTKKKVSRFSTRYITRLERRINIHNSLHLSIVQVENHLTIAYCRYHEFKNDALKLIESWIRYIAALKSKENWENQYGINKSLVTW